MVYLGVKPDTTSPVIEPPKVVVVLDSCDSGNAIAKDINAPTMDYSPEVFDRTAVDAFAAVNTTLESVPQLPHCASLASSLFPA